MVTNPQQDQALEHEVELDLDAVPSADEDRAAGRAKSVRVRSEAGQIRSRAQDASDEARRVVQRSMALTSAAQQEFDRLQRLPKRPHPAPGGLPSHLFRTLYDTLAEDEQRWIDQVLARHQARLAEAEARGEVVSEPHL